MKDHGAGNGAAASWYETTSVAARPRPPLTHDLDVDVCVVGGGLAGLTAAREVARRGWSVAVLEARHVAWNASGRNCGFVLPGFAQPLARIIERVGLDHARDLWNLSQAGVDYVRAAIRDGGMASVDPVPGWLDVSKVDDRDALSDLAELLAAEFGYEAEFWPTERVRAVLKSDFYFQALHFPGAFHLHALNYALGLAAAAEEAGATIYEQTEVVAIDPAGVRKRIETTSARVRAGHLVLAGNVHIGRLVPELAGTLVPVTTYAAVTAPLGPRLRENILYAGAVSDSDRADCHYRIVGGDRLLWAGSFSVWPGDPRRRAGRLAQEIARRYPQLGAVELEYTWSGLMGIPLHRMPQIGEISAGLWVASGFSGHGLNTTAMAGDLIARAIVEGDDRWRLFLPYGLVWTGGLAGRAAVQVAYWVTRAREELAARLSRQSEARHRGASQVGVTPDAGALPGGDPHAPEPAGKKVTAPVKMPSAAGSNDPIEPSAVA